MIRYPSIKTLMQIKDVTREDALKIRQIMKGPYDPRQTRMEKIDVILNTFGVEYQKPGCNKQSPDFYYCNTGDSYARTVLKINGRFYVTSWGDIVERGNYE